MGASHLFVTAPGRLVGRRRAWRTPMTDEQWALLEPKSFENTTTSATGWLQVARIATTLRTCHVHGLPAFSRPQCAWACPRGMRHVRMAAAHAICGRSARFLVSAHPRDAW